jgi:NAD(P)-dependent dehydrogenase (short-subunit alcohol dehydrogenase family)
MVKLSQVMATASQGRKNTMSLSSQRKAMVITGCSSGFGRVTALHMAQRGWQVFATVRKEADQESLLAEAATLGCKEQLTPLICEITVSEQVAALAQTVGASVPSTSRLDALLNNAGTTYAAPMELLPLDDLRAQLEINVIAHVAVTQALLPLLKTARGTIINVSSLSGRFAAPGGGAYCASKFALEAISDAWRVELAPFGVQVVVIEPAFYATSIWKTGKDRDRTRLGPHRGGPYERLLAGLEKFPERSASHAHSPQEFAETVEKIFTSRRPHTRYVLPRAEIWSTLLYQVLPDRVRDRVLRHMLKW